MRKHFNTEGCCYPDEHYMVNPDSRLKKIKEMVDAGKYFTINRGRQYGKIWKTDNTGKAAVCFINFL